MPALMLDRQEYTLDELLREIIRPCDDVWHAVVKKRRFHFELDHCLAEIVEVLIDGTSIGSVAVESEYAPPVLDAIEQLGLGGFENISYTDAIGRVIGLEAWP